MLSARPGAVLEVEADAFPTGLEGTIGVEVIDTPAGNVVTARTTAGILERPAGSGLYAVTIVAPAAVGVYSVVWDTGGPDPRFARERLEVTGNGLTLAAAPAPGAYAALGDLEAELADRGIATPAPDVAERLLARATSDVDAAIGPARLIGTGDYAGRKLDPTALLEEHRAALARGTAAQARHRLEAAAVSAAVPAGAKRVQGPDFTIDYDAAAVAGGRFAVELADELAVLGLPRRTARA